MAKDKNKKSAAKKAQPKKHDSKAKVSHKKGGHVVVEKKNIFGKLWEYLVGVRAELKRVTWPTREKVIYLVGVVVVTLLFFAAFTATIDWLSSEGIVGLNSLTHDGPALTNEVPVEVDLGDLNLGGAEGTETVIEPDADGVVIEEVPATVETE